MGVVIRRWVWLVGMVVRRYIDFLILLIPTPLVSALFCSSIPTFCSFLYTRKMEGILLTYSPAHIFTRPQYAAYGYCAAEVMTNYTQFESFMFASCAIDVIDSRGPPRDHCRMHA